MEPVTRIYFLIFALFAGCASHDTNSSVANVRQFDAGPAAVFVNAYLIETQNGVVAIDATLTESSSKALHQKLVGIGKPLKAVLLTHGHPDHYNGVTNLVAGDNVDIIATAGTDKVIREDDTKKEKQWSALFGPEWPKKRTFPNRILKDGESIVIDGVSFTVHDLGKGESHSDSYWVMQTNGKKSAFVGDVVMNQVHAYTADGHTTEWLKNIENLKRDLAGVDKVYAGHGESGDLESLDWQRNYLLEYRKTVASIAQGKSTLTDDQKKQLTTHMNEYLSNKRNDFLIGLGADAVAGELVVQK